MSSLEQREPNRRYSISDAQIWLKYKFLPISKINVVVLQLKKRVISYEDWQFVSAGPAGRCTILVRHVLACWCYQQGCCVFFSYISTLASWKSFTGITTVSIIWTVTKVGLGRIFQAFPLVWRMCPGREASHCALLWAISIELIFSQNFSFTEKAWCPCKITNICSLNHAHIILYHVNFGTKQLKGLCELAFESHMDLPVPEGVESPGLWLLL